MSSNSANSDSKDSGIYKVQNRGENSSTGISLSRNRSSLDRIKFERESLTPVTDDIKCEQTQD